MKNIKLVILILNLCVYTAYGQKIKLEANNLVANQVSMSFEKLQGKKVVKVIKDSTVKAIDEATFVRIKDLDFKDGIIEVKVLSRLLKNASPSDRGFIGVAFRSNADNSKFECIYIRPTNGRADEQIRRNHSIQHFSFPDLKVTKR